MVWLGVLFLAGALNWIALRNYKKRSLSAYEIKMIREQIRKVG